MQKSCTLCIYIFAIIMAIISTILVILAPTLPQKNSDSSSSSSSPQSKTILQAPKEKILPINEHFQAFKPAFKQPQNIQKIN
ncbi:hypothetical protein M0811_05298 [Anaeramoeba ignava]|uniref:Uncharacterized protein n=1 Tax=Anaeramoeba ignava TaxID=1746090 RepID=A0A9Q0REQ8_ANAIG|nr:hypothetical protein M0811_05298 [Anaeramoeba ignava]